ncbi:MAG TPA: VWA domain-containing protein [Sedimentisphaerales bacterium]|nr:VWA domain-containing protein [Sedimentisphaerales bacterium]
MASVAVHLIVLTLFGIAGFSQYSTEGSRRPTPTAAISRIRELVQAAPVIPKPKVKRASVQHFAGSSESVLAAGRLFGAVRPVSHNIQSLAGSLPSRSTLMLPGGRASPHKVEFFGSSTEHRKVCYVVDCSGSMRGMFSKLRQRLKASIGDMLPDQYFYIIFFGDGRLFEFGGGRLVRATQEGRSAAYDFIDSVRPAGQTNAVAALERALQIRDGQGDSPSVIYFLTDGFELAAEDQQRFSQTIAALQRQFAPATIINTIGFWPQSRDRNMLETIASQTGGEFVFVADDEIDRPGLLGALEEGSFQ